MPMRVIGVALVLAAVASSASFATRAEAAREKKQQFLVLRMEGEGIDADTLARLDAAARKQTAESTKPSKLLPPPALDFESMRVAAGCSDDNARCLAAIGDTLSATQVVRVRVAKAGEVGAKFNIAVVKVKDAKMQTSTLEVPVLDTVAIEELRFAIAAIFGDKRPAPPKRPEAPGGIALIAGNPDISLDDVEIFLDDKKFPVTALRNLPLGQHQLEVHKPGHEPFMWSGAVRAGQQTKVTVELRPIAEEVEVEAELAANAQSIPDYKETPVIEEKPAEPALAIDATSTETNIAPPREKKLFYTYMLAGGAVAMSAVGIGGWAYLNSVEGRLENSCNGMVVEGEDGKRRCEGDLTFTGCPDSGDQPDRCKNGELGSTLSWVGFVGGALLAAGAVGMFFYEDGPAIVSGESADPSAAIVPLPDGVAATFRAPW